MSDIDPAALASELRHSVTRLYLALRRNSPITAISAAQASALATLYDYGPARMGALADREGIRMPTATTLVDVLTRDGLVARAPDPDDRRAVVVALTDAGRAIVERVRIERDDVLSAALEQMPPEELTALAALAPALRDIHARLEK